MKLFKLSLIIQIIKNPQIPKLIYENLEKLKKYNERCRDPIWVLSPRVKRVLAQRVQYNELVESVSEN